MAKGTTRAAGRLHLMTARGVLNAGDGDHSDGGGLMLRVRGETAAWVLRYTAPSGKRREMGLGTAHRGEVQKAGATLTAARDLAHQCREQLRLGIDPIDARAGRREAERDADEARKARRKRDHWTLARCARDYHERVIEPNRTEKHGAQWIASLENHVHGGLWDRPIGDVTPPELLAALLAIKPHERARNHKGDRPAETIARIRQRLDAIFEDAIFHGRCSANAAAAIKRKLVEAMPGDRTENMRSLPYRDAPAFMRALRRQAGVAARCLELLMLTAARTNEVNGLLAEELDLDAGRWVVPAEKMKAGEEHEVFLPVAAVEMLRAHLELKLHASIVFPAPVKTDQQSRPRKSEHGQKWKRLLRWARIEPETKEQKA